MFRDAAGNTAEHVRYVEPAREVLVCRAPCGRLLGTGYRDGEVPWTPDRPDLVTSGLAQLGVDTGTLVPT